jgi:hypothetical protein
MTVVLAGLCLASQLSGLAHLAMVPHVACAEHGELVEPGHGGLGSRSVLPVGAPARVQVWPAEAGLSPRHGHDHCLLAAWRRSPATLSVRPASVEARPTEGPVAGRERRAPTASTLAVLAVAPKSSPPEV